MSETSPIYQVGHVQGARLVLMECPVAGFQFHEGEAHWSQMKPCDALTLRREPGNRHDPRAVRVEWRGVALGYLPREANYTVSQMLDRGEAVEAHIRELRVSADPWKRVMIEVAVPGVTGGAATKEAPASRPVVAPPPATIAIDACVRMKRVPPLNLVPVGGTDERWQKMIDLLESVHVDIARRLALPAAACTRGDMRSVTLWNAIEISVDPSGRDLQIRYVDGGTDTRPRVSLDLTQPIGPAAWSQAFVPVLWRACVRDGIHTSRIIGPFGTWIHRSLRLTFRSYVDFGTLRRKVLEFLAPDPLAHSLTNRIFGSDAMAQGFNWVGDHAMPLAQVGIDHPALLPFLRCLPEGLACRADPIGTLQGHLLAHGLEPGAWKRLELWGFQTFDDFLDNLAAMPGALVEYANLLHRLEVQDVPPGLFSHLAGWAAAFDGVDIATRTLRWIPDWFMRALLREAEETSEGDADRLAGELGQALPWLRDTNPEPDSNQRKAGWYWISHQAIEHDLALEAVKWTVPCETLVEGPYLVVPLRSGAELREEAIAMKNCLEDYEDQCARGILIVFSIRRADNHKRLACFMVAKTRHLLRDLWELEQIAGKMNSPVSHEMSRVADTVVARLNGEKPF